jgi:hypothetical protein
MLVGGIANDERHAPFGACCDRTGRKDEQHQNNRRESVHLLSPHSLLINSRIARTLGSSAEALGIGRASVYRV